MSVRTYLLVVVITLLSAVGGWVSAQVVPEKVAPPIVLSGLDVGFRITAHEGDTPIGAIVVRIDGKWVDARLGLALVPKP